MLILSMLKPESFEKLKDEDIIILDKEKDIKKKFSMLANMLQLTASDLQERRRIVNKIINVLKPYYPECTVEMFGSSMNGFGNRGCDLDLLFLPFPEYCNVDFRECEDTNPRPYRVVNGSYPMQRLYEMNEKSHLQFAKRVMDIKRYFFRNIIYIPAKCPILNIEFTSADIKCDFSCSNRLVLCNTALLRLFGELDYRVKLLVILLRYWAKSVGLIKKSLLSSYAFTIMVIFALQNTDPPILPSVKTLSEMAGFSFKIDDWETALPSARNILSYLHRIASNNTASLEQLMIHFLDFYWNFDFVQNVISPYFGRPLPVKELLESSNERIRSFQLTSFNIQDPFVLNRNISRNKAMKTAFKLVLLIAKELVLKRDWSLHEFLNVDFYHKKMDSVHAPVYSYLEDMIESVSLNLSYTISLKLGITDQLQPWYEKVSSIAYEVLHYGLSMQCEVVDKIIWPKVSSDYQPSRKKQKTISDSNILYSEANLELISSIQCTVFFQTWCNRKKIEIPEDFIIDIDLCNTLKKEYIISKLLIPKDCQIKEPLVVFMCNIYKYASQQISDIVFLFTPVTNNKPMFESLSTFLKSYVLKTVENVLWEN